MKSCLVSGNHPPTQGENQIWFRLFQLNTKMLNSFQHFISLFKQYQQLKSSVPLPWGCPNQVGTAAHLSSHTTECQPCPSSQFGLSNVIRNTEQMGRWGDAASSSSREDACSKFKIKPSCRCFLHNMDSSLACVTWNTAASLQTTRPWLPRGFGLCSHPDMLQIFAVYRVEDAVGSYQLHSTLYVDINYSSTLAVLKRQKRKRIHHLGKVLHTHTYMCSAYIVQRQAAFQACSVLPFRPSFWKGTSEDPKATQKVRSLLSTCNVSFPVNTAAEAAAQKMLHLGK